MSFSHCTTTVAVASKGLPRLRFLAVPDDFDVWNAPTLSFSHVDIAAVPTGEWSVSHRNVRLSFNTTTRKILTFKFSFFFHLS